MSEQPSTSSPPAIDVSQAGIGVFRPHADSMFELRHGDSEPVNAKLTQLDELPDHRGSVDGKARRKPYSLVFDCNIGGIPQGMYTLTHPELGSVDLFLVPIAGNADATSLEAVIN